MAEAVVVAVAWFHHHSPMEVVGSVVVAHLVVGCRSVEVEVGEEVEVEVAGAGMVAVVVAAPQSFLISQHTFCFICRCDRILQFLHITTTNSQICTEKY